MSECFQQRSVEGGTLWLWVDSTSWQKGLNGVKGESQWVLALSFSALRPATMWTGPPRGQDVLSDCETVGQDKPSPTQSFTLGILLQQCGRSLSILTAMSAPWTCVCRPPTKGAGLSGRDAWLRGEDGGRQPECQVSCPRKKRSPQMVGICQHDSGVILTPPAKTATI